MRLKQANGGFAAGEVIDGGNGVDTLVLSNAMTVDFSTGTLQGIEKLTGSSGDDILTLTAAQYQQLQSTSTIAMGTSSGDKLTVLVEGAVDLGGARPAVSGLDTGTIKSLNGNASLTISGTALDSLVPAISFASALDLLSGSTLNLTSASSFLGAGLALGATDNRLKGVSVISAATSSNAVNINLSSRPRRSR